MNNDSRTVIKAASYVECAGILDMRASAYEEQGERHGARVIREEADRLRQKGHSLRYDSKPSGGAQLEGVALVAGSTPEKLSHVLRSGWQSDCPACMASKFTCDSHYARDGDDVTTLELAKIEALLAKRDSGDEVSGYQAFRLLVRIWPKLKLASERAARFERAYVNLQIKTTPTGLA